MRYTIYTYPINERFARIDYDEFYVTIEEAKKAVESKVTDSINCGGIDCENKEVLLYYTNNKWGEDY